MEMSPIDNFRALLYTPFRFEAIGGVGDFVKIFFVNHPTNAAETLLQSLNLPVFEFDRRGATENA